MIVLISNIGATDPIRGTKDKEKRDGPALHIARVYQPDIIYLISTKEMREKNTIKTKMHIEHLYQKLNKEVKIFILDLNENDPSDFDEMHIYEKIHNEIYEKNKDAVILVNITSGTPQMQASVCLDIVTNDRGFKPIQVITPQKGANTNIPHITGGEAERTDDNFDDYPEFFINRCREPNIFMFRNSMLKVKLKKAIESYDYKAALELIKDVHLYKNTKIKAMIEFAYGYYSMENDSDFFRKAQGFGLSLKTISNYHVRLITQAYNLLKIKFYKHEYVDFANRITPLMFCIAKQVFRQKDSKRYDSIVTTDRNDVEILGCAKAATLGLLNNAAYNDKQILGYKHFVEMFKNGDFTKVDVRIYEDLRDFEQKIRNKTAHDLKPFTKNYIEKKTGKKIESVLKDISKIIVNEFGVKTENLNFFESINEIILNEINTTP